VRIVDDEASTKLKNWSCWF